MGDLKENSRFIFLVSIFVFNREESRNYTIRFVKSAYITFFILVMQYYKYVLETPFALTGSHNLAKVTAKGSTVVLFVASANDKQWQASQKTLQSMLDSFQV